MALKTELMASSLPPSAANKLGFDPLTVFAAAGNNQATATPLTSNCANITSGSGGVILTSFEQQYMILNNIGGALNVYPPVGGAFNGGTVNSPFSHTNAKSLFIEPVGGGNFIASLSA